MEGSEQATRGGSEGGPASAPAEPQAIAAWLVRFYGIDPERLFHLPQWILRVLTSQMPVVEAAEMERDIQVETYPYLDRHDRRDLSRQLRRWVSALYPVEKPERAPIKKEQIDPEQAAEYFAAMGSKVVKSG